MALIGKLPRSYPRRHHRPMFKPLDPVAHAVGEVLGALYPRTLTRTDIHQIITATRFEAGRPKTTKSQIGSAITELVQTGTVVESERRGYFVAEKRWANPMALSAARAGRLEPIVRASEGEWSSLRAHSYMFGADLQIKVRYLVLTDHADRLTGLWNLEAVDWSTFCEAESSQYLMKLPLAVRTEAIRDCVRSLTDDFAESDGLLNNLEIGALAVPEILDQLAFVFVLQGAFTQALNLFMQAPDSREKRVSLASVEAFIATAQGNDDAAIQAIERAIAAQKHGTRKRKVFGDNPAFVYALLSLVRVDTPVATKLLVELLKVAESRELQRDIRALVRAAYYTRDGSQIRFHQPPNAHYSMMQALASCWGDDFSPFNGHDALQTFVQVAEQARDHGYLWLHGELGAVVAAMAAAKVKLPGSFDHHEYVQTAAAARESLSTVPLTGVVQRLAEWEYPLKRLEQAAFEWAKRTAKPTKATAKKQRRLAWVLELDAHLGYADVTAKEQSANRNGSWTNGRTVSLKRLASGSGALDFLSDQDRAVAACLKQERSWGRSGEYYLAPSGWYELAGHSHTINTDGEAVEVVRCDPKLVVERSSVGTISVVMQPYSLSSETYEMHVESTQRVEVTRFTRKHQELLEIIPEDGLSLPETAQSRVLDAVAAMAGDIQIVSGLEGVESASAEVVPADPEPWVCLLPAGDGLNVTLIVDPIAGAGAHFTPGEGNSTVIARRGTNVVQTHRDLAVERAAVTAIAARCPPLEAACDGTTLALDTPQACLDLVDLLEREQVRCLWPDGEPFRIAARVEATQLKLDIKSAAEWFSASGSLVVDATLEVQLRQLLDLVAASPGQRFIELEKGSFLSLSEGFRRQLDELSRLTAAGRGNSVRIHPMAAMALDELSGEAQVEADKRWRAHCQRMAQARTFEPQLPSTLQADLRPYQVDGFCWLARLAKWGAGACLADDMGLGKTVQTLALLLHRASDGPALVIAPTSVVPNWLAETARFAPTLKVIHYAGTPERRASMVQDLTGFDLVVATYGLLQNDIEQLAAIHWASVILDEAQAIKNARTGRAKAARALRADFRLATTGTPVQNNLGDLHSLFGFINPGMMGSDAHFHRRFVVPIERDNDAAARHALRRVVAPYMLRRLKTDVLTDLPPRTEITLHVDLSAEEAALYEALRKRALDDLEGAASGVRADGARNAGETHIRVLAHLTKLRLASCNPSLVMDGVAPPSAKLQAFSLTLSDLLEGRHKVLVFSQFVSHLKLIEAHLKEAGIAYQYLDGHTPAKARAQRVAAFQSGVGEVFLISLKAGGTGLNLTAADYVIHMDPWWNPAVEDQASDRAHRIGQTRPVTIYRLVARGTIEEQIIDLHHRKRDLADRLLEGTDAPGALSAAELITLLRDTGSSPT